MITKDVADHIEESQKRLTGRQFVVAIRLQNGGPTLWEELFVKQLRALGGTATELPHPTGNLLWRGGRNVIPSGFEGFVGTVDGKNGLSGHFFLKCASREEYGSMPVHLQPDIVPFKATRCNAAELQTSLAEFIYYYVH